MAGLIRYVGGRSTSGSIRLDLDEKSLARGRRLLDKYRDKPLNIRMQKATLAAARVLEAPIRDASPVSRDATPGQLRKSVRARPSRYRKAYVYGRGWRTQSSVDALVGPLDRKRHLVIRGHRIVTRGGRDTGRRTRPNPFVDTVSARLYGKAVAEMRKYIFDTRYEG